MLPAAGAVCLRLQSAEQTGLPPGEEPVRRGEKARRTSEEIRSGEGRSHGSRSAVDSRRCPGLLLMTTLHLTKPSAKEIQIHFRTRVAFPDMTMCAQKCVCVFNFAPERCPAVCLVVSQCVFSSSACQSLHYHSAPEGRAETFRSLGGRGSMQLINNNNNNNNTCPLTSSFLVSIMTSLSLSSI